MISSGSSSFLNDSLADQNELFLGKASGNTGGTYGRWHIFEDENGISICGKCDSGDLTRLGTRSFDPSVDELDEVKGLGKVCGLCREYLTGSLSDRELPKPSVGTDKTCLVDKWERNVREQ